jgi:hypothetical protein
LFGDVEFGGDRFPRYAEFAGAGAGVGVGDGEGLGVLDVELFAVEVGERCADLASFLPSSGG